MDAFWLLGLPALWVLFLAIGGKLAERFGWDEW